MAEWPSGKRPGLETVHANELENQQILWYE